MKEKRLKRRSPKQVEKARKHTQSNVRSLNNKMEEITMHLKFAKDFRRSNLICFTETWLHEDSTEIDIESYLADRFTFRGSLGKSP